MRFLEKEWKQPDHGIWEVRGPKRHFTHSKVMAWVALDRAIKEVEQFKMPGPLERWKTIRADIHAEVSSQGYDPVRGTFTQYYGSEELDASLLMIPLVGFLPPEDPRVAGTVEAIEQILDYPFPENLTAAKTGSAVAWTLNERGLHNIYMAEAPEFRPRRLTNYSEDDGRDAATR